MKSSVILIEIIFTKKVPSFFKVASLRFISTFLPNKTCSCFNSGK